MMMFWIDAQDALPWAFCGDCGCEIYDEGHDRGGRCLCGKCYEEAREEP